jgi:hypothetical protein
LIELTVPILPLALEREVVRDGLDDVLAVVEHAFHAQVVDVRSCRLNICACWNGLIFCAATA